MLEPHTTLFVAMTGIGKMHIALDLLKREYLGHFDFIIILCPTLRHNETDLYIIPLEWGNDLYDWIEKLGAFLDGHKTLFLIDNIIANETFDK